MIGIEINSQLNPTATSLPRTGLKTKNMMWNATPKQNRSWSTVERTAVHAASVQNNPQESKRKVFFPSLTILIGRPSLFSIN